MPLVPCRVTNEFGDALLASIPRGLGESADPQGIFASGITATITEPEPAIVHFRNTRKPGFACITSLFAGPRPRKPSRRQPD